MTDIPVRQTIEIEYYDTPTLVFHWLTALLVIAQFGTAMVWKYALPHNRTWRPLLESTHVSMGILFAVLILLRVVWRLTGMRRLPVEIGWSGFLSRIMYGVLYILLIANVVFGFLLRWLQGETFSFFGLFTVPALLSPDRALAHQVEGIHNYTSWVIVLLAAGHAAAALVHHYVLKDRVMDRMTYRRAR